MASHPPISPERERQLLRQIQQGDRGALGELLGAYHKRVYHVCLRMVSHTDDAADLAQESLLRAVKHIDTFRHGSRFSTWLLRIAMNLSISHLRKGRGRKTVSLEHAVGYDDTSDQAQQLKQMIAQDREPPASASVEMQEQVRRMLAALDGLETPLRSVIILRDLQGMDYQQIAEALGVPVGTVKSRLFRARLALREAMEGGSIQARREVADG